MREASRTEGVRAPPVVTGSSRRMRWSPRQRPPRPTETVTAPARHNRFQGRYIVRKPFDPSQCDRQYLAGFTPAGAPLAGAARNQTASRKLTLPFESFALPDAARAVVAFVVGEPSRNFRKPRILRLGMGGEIEFLRK